MQYFLDFEKPIAELEGKIEELRHLSDDGEINISDPIFLLGFLFNQGAVPPAPGPFVPDLDPTPDNLGCKG